MRVLFCIFKTFFVDSYKLPTKKKTNLPIERSEKSAYCIGLFCRSIPIVFIYRECVRFHWIEIQRVLDVIFSNRLELF